MKKTIFVQHLLRDVLVHKQMSISEQRCFTQNICPSREGIVDPWLSPLSNLCYNMESLSKNIPWANLGRRVAARCGALRLPAAPSKLAKRTFEWPHRRSPLTSASKGLNGQDRRAALSKGLAEAFRSDKPLVLTNMGTCWRDGARTIITSLARQAWAATIKACHLDRWEQVIRWLLGV